jgi:TRAP-type C4-dicarboxylate transport system permease small subunit
MTEPSPNAQDQAVYVPRRIVSFESLVVTMNAIGSVFIVFIMAMICVDIVSRFAFNHPISGVAELTEIIIVGVVFMQLAHATRLGKLTRSDAAYGILMVRRPRYAHLLGILYDGAGAFLLGVIAWGTWPKFTTAWDSNFYIGNVGVFTFPEWPLWALVVVGSAVISVQFVLLVIHHIRGAIANTTDALYIGEG